MGWAVAPPHIIIISFQKNCLCMFQQILKIENINEYSIFFFLNYLVFDSAKT